MIEAFKKELEHLKHDMLAHPIAGMLHLIAHITQNDFTHELAQAAHDSIGQCRKNRGNET